LENKSPGSYGTIINIPEDPEELALNLNGKKRKLKRNDFNEAMSKATIPKKAIENLWIRIENGTQHWPELIKNSFLSKEKKETLLALFLTKAAQIELN
jgi:serine/threonine-protein kinase HipA